MSVFRYFSPKWKFILSIWFTISFWPISMKKTFKFFLLQNPFFFLLFWTTSSGVNRLTLENKTVKIWLNRLWKWKQKKCHLHTSNSSICFIFILWIFCVIEIIFMSNHVWLKWIVNEYFFFKLAIRSKFIQMKFRCILNFLSLSQWKVAFIFVWI